MLYSPFKAGYFLDKIARLRNKEERYKVYPVHIQIDLTNRCNHNCLFCIYRHNNNRLIKDYDVKSYLDFNRLIKVLEEVKDYGVKAIQLTGGGEPLVYYRIDNLLDYLAETDFELALVTNGVLLNDDKIRKLEKFSWIRVSIDAGSKQTYSKMRLVDEGQYDKVMLNLQKLVKMLPNVIIGVSFIITPLNYKEIVDFAKIVKDIGVNNVRYTLAYTDKKQHLFEGIWDDIVKYTEEAQKYSDSNFTVFDLEKRYFVHLSSKKTYKACGYSFFTTVIEANGNVRPCCTLKGNVDRDSLWGNINNEKFEDIWLGEKRRMWLEKFDSNRCILCWMDSKNEFIDYLISEQLPPHVNFV